ncbi:isoprenoid synthase domain-containing protein [Gymnopilus junonius]|uniref:Terpene synthase n=1 Tax=Gymnopilus junonius TaxID=109634 RepID=A0A9P5NX46_GYMJU|nr:isoprenoid synthase domain-containing protein [Gymnopilus junonius]
MSPSPRQFRLPNLLATCPLKDATNPYYRQASAESRAWINSYDIFTDRKRAFFVQGVNELLCSHVYWYADCEQLRTTCDFVNLLFVVDEVSDEQNGLDAAATGQIFLKAMQYPDWDDDSILAKITKEFRARFLGRAGPRNVRRFIELCDKYTQCVAVEAELRERNKVADLASFVSLRRYNSAVLLCFALVEYILGIDLDDEVYEDEAFLEAYWAACDHVCWANDVYSYDMEQSKGISGNNIVTVLMQENGTSLQDTADQIGVRCGEFVNTYLSAKKRLAPSLGADAARFIEAIGSWMIGNLEWSFETVRYFGSRHLEVKETGIVILRPREVSNDSFSESDEE